MKKLYHKLEEIETKTPTWLKTVILLILLCVLGYVVWLNLTL